MEELVLLASFAAGLLASPPRSGLSWSVGRAGAEGGRVGPTLRLAAPQ